MKRITALFLTLVLAAAMLPSAAFAVNKDKSAFSSVTFTKSETKTYQMKTFNGFTVKSGVTLTLSGKSGFEIAGDLVVESGAKLLGQEGKGDFTFTTGPQTTITGIDLYYRHDQRDGSPLQTLKWPCTLQYARQNVPLIKEMTDQGMYPAFKWDNSIPGWVMTVTLNNNPFNEPSLFYHQSRARSTATELAGKLNKLGLFAGVGTKADGTINYDLWRRGTRVEAVVILIKLLGLNDAVMEKDALVKSGQAEWNCPFEDVKKECAWAIPYIAFAYENGLTSGQSASTFGLGKVTYQQYCCFLLNALGYTNDDFPGSNIWAGCMAKCEEIGASAYGTPDTVCHIDDYFWRADMVIMAWQALECDVVSEENHQRLFMKLEGNGVFTHELFESVR